jgi:branched-subunit amino acid transport protein
MSYFWVSLIGGSVVVFALRYAGHLVPEKYLANPRVMRINNLIPVALMSALVAIETFTKQGVLVLDQRVAGLAVAVVALLLRAPFAVVVVSAAAASAAVFRLI